MVAFKDLLVKVDFGLDAGLDEEVAIGIGERAGAALLAGDCSQ